MAFALVQVKTASGSSTTPRVTLDAAPTKGNLLVAMVACATATAVVTNGTGWFTASAEHANATGTGSTARMVYKRVGDDLAALQSPATLGGSKTWVICIAEFSGGANVLDVGSSTTPTNPNLAAKTTPAGADPTNGVDILIVGGGAAPAGNTWTDASNLVNGSHVGVAADDGDVLSGTVICACLFHKIESPTTNVGDYTITATASANLGGSAHMGIFKAGTVNGRLQVAWVELEVPAA